MRDLLTVRHATTYRYARPVTFGPHRLMLRPRDRHDLRLVDRRADAVAAGQRALDARRVRQFGRAGRFPSAPPHCSHHQHAQDRTLRHRRAGSFRSRRRPNSIPSSIRASDRVDLGRLLEQHYPDPQRRAGDAGPKASSPRGRCARYDLLTRHEAATQAAYRLRRAPRAGHAGAVETLERKSGACRDFAMVFIEAARYLGFGARFVTGYLYDPALDGGDATQAVGRDPCLGGCLSAGRRLDRIRPDRRADRRRQCYPRRGARAIPRRRSRFRAATPAQASDFLGMKVEVTVTRPGLTPVEPRRCAIAAVREPLKFVNDAKTFAHGLLRPWANGVESLKLSC